MSLANDRHLALLRGVNVSGANRIRMVDLRDLFARLGMPNARTYIQSGNVIFDAPGAGGNAALESRIEAGIATAFSLTIPAIVRSASEWIRIVDACPLQAEAAADPSRVYAILSKDPLRPDAAARLRERAAAGEVVRLAAGCLWIHFPNGSARSKLTPAVLDRAAGSPVTARNRNTVTALAGLLSADADG